jgi:hypothetical protein
MAVVQVASKAMQGHGAGGKWVAVQVVVKAAGCGMVCQEIAYLSQQAST